MTSSLVGWKEPSRAKASVGSPGAEQRRPLETGRGMKRCDGGHVPARRTPEEEGGEPQKSGSGLFTHTCHIYHKCTVAAQHALPRQGPDHEDEESAEKSLGVPVHCRHSSSASVPPRLGLWVESGPLPAPTQLDYNTPNPDTNAHRGPSHPTSGAVMCWWRRNSCQTLG